MTDDELSVFWLRLETASGFLKVGTLREARDQMDQIPDPLKNSQEVLQIWTRIYHAEGDWEKMREFAEFLTLEWPEVADHWVDLGIATRRCRTIEEAERVLLWATALHDSEPTIHYNLACYQAQMNHLHQAREHLQKAISLEPEIRNEALEDPDLERLWNELGKR